MYAADVVQTILEATIRLIARGGVDAVRYRDVAAESGVPLGTISYQFPKREGLIRGAFTHYLSEAAVSLRALASGFDIKTPEHVAALLAEVLRIDVVDPNRRYLAEFELVVYAARDPIVAEALAKWNRLLVAELGAILEPVGISMPLSTARTLIDLIRGFQIYRLGERELEIDDFRARAERFLLAFVAPRQPSPKARGKTHDPIVRSKRTRSAKAR